MIKTLQENPVSLRLGNSMFHISVSLSLRTFRSATRADGMDYLLSGLNASSGYKTGARSPEWHFQGKTNLSLRKNSKDCGLFLPSFSLVISGQRDSKWVWIFCPEGFALKGVHLFYIHFVYVWYTPGIGPGSGHSNEQDRPSRAHSLVEKIDTHQICICNHASICKYKPYASINHGSCHRRKA